MAAALVPGSLLHIPFAYIIFITFALPTFSLFTIATLGFYLHFEETTVTHCHEGRHVSVVIAFMASYIPGYEWSGFKYVSLQKVQNMIPSISAVVGGVSPERYIWRLGIALFSFPRLLDSLLYYNFLGQDMTQVWMKILNKLLFLLHWVQYFSLFGLTYISSKESYTAHRNCFIGFIVGSISHMVLFLFLFKSVRYPPTYRDKISFRLRVAFAASHILLFVTSLYFFWRHNTYCEPYKFIDFQNDFYLTVAPPQLHYRVH